MTCTCLKCGRAFRAYGPAPKDRCHACRREIRRATWREAQRRRRAARTCRACQTDITARPPQSVYCVPCAEAAERERDRVQRRERYAAEQRRRLGPPALDDVITAAAAARWAPRDLALEARIDAHLAHIRRTRRFAIEDVIWARRVDPVAAEAPDVRGASLCLAVETRRNRQSRAKRLAAAERRAVAAEKGAA